MKIIKTITQHGCTYSIKQFGNCSFRLAYRCGNERPKNVECVFDSISECEEYISSIANCDALIAQIVEKSNAAKEVNR